MTAVDERYRTPGTEIILDVDARCLVCDGIEHLIAGDGDVVCRTCLDLRAGIANDPAAGEPFFVEALQADHSDVVSLVPIANRDGVRFEWHWSAPWPGADARA